MSFQRVIGPLLSQYENRKQPKYPLSPGLSGVSALYNQAA